MTPQVYVSILQVKTAQKAAYNGNDAKASPCIQRNRLEGSLWTPKIKGYFVIGRAVEGHSVK